MRRSRDSAAALLEGAPLDLTLKDGDPGIGAVPVLADTVRLIDRDRAVDDLPGYADGRFWVQDAAAAIPARLIHVARGSRVLDLCAAPGGKTAQLVKAGYAVTALDRDPERMARLATNLERLGYAAELVTADAFDYAPSLPFDAFCSMRRVRRPAPSAAIPRSSGTAMPPTSPAGSRCSAA